jgi:hypothetical protein
MNDTPRRYQIPQREAAKRNIRKLLMEGYSNREICEITKLPDRTMRRYLSEIYATDNEILIAPSIEENATLTNIYIDRLAAQRRQVCEIANDKSIDASARISAHNMAANMDQAMLNLLSQTPGTLARSLQLTSNLIEERRGLNLRLRFEPTATATATTTEQEHNSTPSAD